MTPDHQHITVSEGACGARKFSILGSPSNLQNSNRSITWDSDVCVCEWVTFIGAAAASHLYLTLVHTSSMPSKVQLQHAANGIGNFHRSPQATCQIRGTNPGFCYCSQIPNLVRKHLPGPPDPARDTRYTQHDHTAKSPLKLAEYLWVVIDTQTIVCVIGFYFIEVDLSVSQHITPLPGAPDEAITTWCHDLYVQGPASILIAGHMGT